MKEPRRLARQCRGLIVETIDLSVPAVHPCRKPAAGDDVWCVLHQHRTERQELLQKLLVANWRDVIVHRAEPEAESIRERKTRVGKIPKPASPFTSEFPSIFTKKTVSSP